MAFVPRSKRGTPAEVEHLAFREDIPDHLVTALDDWIQEQLIVEDFDWMGQRQPTFNGPYLRQIELELQVPLGSDNHMVDRLFYHLRANGDNYWDLVDYLLRSPLSVTSPRVGIYLSPHERAEALENVLSLGRSAWTVRPLGDTHCLERRVDGTAELAALTVIGAAETAGLHLSKAWHLAYGRIPKPSESYHESIKAVEVAAIPIVVPNDGFATLGKVLGEIRAHPQKCTVTTPASSTAMPDSQLIIAMMDALWTGQAGRHGDPNLSIPAVQTCEEARIAVHLAVTLVQWFMTGAVR